MLIGIMAKSGLRENPLKNFVVIITQFFYKMKPQYYLWHGDEEQVVKQTGLTRLFGPVS